MTRFTKRDLRFSILTGILTGAIAWLIFDFLNVPEFHRLSFALLIIVAPIVFILGTWLGYFLGQWLKFFDQFGKFCVIGLTNAAIDFGVLNLLIARVGHDAGWWYMGFKGASFIVASLASYAFNKYWAFNAANTRGGGVEFSKFFSVAIVSLIINNLVASLVVNGFHPMLGLDSHQWANIGAVSGSAVALIFSFLGYKFAVFKK